MGLTLFDERSDDAGSGTEPQLHVILNWSEELRQRVPVN